MSEPPRFVLLPGVGDESISEFVGKVCEGVFTAFAFIESNVSDESGGDDVFRAEDVSPETTVSFKIIDVKGVRTGVSNIGI